MVYVFFTSMTTKAERIRQSFSAIQQLPGYSSFMFCTAFGAGSNHICCNCIVIGVCLVYNCTSQIMEKGQTDFIDNIITYFRIN